MKTLLLLLFTTSLFSQVAIEQGSARRSYLYAEGENFQKKKVKEDQAIKKDHIDFSKEELVFKLHGTIEIDGHQFKNDTAKCGIIYFSNLDGTTIQDTCKKVIYNHRKCDVVNCKIIHLTKKEYLEPQFYSPNNNGWGTLKAL